MDDTKLKDSSEPTRPIGQDEWRAMTGEINITGMLDFKNKIKDEVKLDIAAEATLLGSEIEPTTEDDETEKDMDAEKASTVLIDEISKLNGQVNIDAFKIQTEIQPKQNKLEDELTALKLNVDVLQKYIARDVQPQFDDFSSAINYLIESSQGSFSEDPLVSKSEQNYMFDVRLRQASDPPAWT